MVVGFVIWSIVAIIFIGIGISCRKSKEVVGFFTFVKPPVIENVQNYNNAVSTLWIIAAVVLETIGIPILFLEQNSPLFILMMFAVIIWVIAIMIVYLRIENHYTKGGVNREEL